MTYELMVYEDGRLDSIERYEDEEAFGFAYAEYCSLGYDGREYSANRARVARVC